MAGFLDVLLRGGLLVLVSVAAGGIAWLGLVARVEPHTKPDGAAVASLRLVAAASGLAALAQAAVSIAVVAQLRGALGAAAIGAYLDTGFARVTFARVLLAVGLAVLALRLARRPAGRTAWVAAAVLAGLLVVSAAALSHAMARVEDRPLLVVLDAVHQLAVAGWVGGLAHLTLNALRSRGEPDPRDRVLGRRFSRLSFVSVTTLLGTGVALTLAYVGDPGALVGTAYGVMILSKLALLGAALGLATLNQRMVWRAAAGITSLRLARFVEIELGLAVTIIYAAASLTSLPPAVDVREDRATLAEVAARFQPAPPRLTSPPLAQLLEEADPLMAPPGGRKAVERAWSEFNHHWAGLFVTVMGLLAALERLGVRWARHWPLVFLGLAAFLFARNDPRAWPLGPAGFWESLALPDVLQHRTFVGLTVAFGIFEWMVRTGRLPFRPWGYVFPLVCALGGGLLLTHSHAMFSLKEEFLTEVTHAPLGILGAFAGWGRWLEVRLPAAGRLPGWLWIGSLTAVGLLLLIYREG